MNTKTPRSKRSVSPNAFPSRTSALIRRCRALRALAQLWPPLSSPSLCDLREMPPRILRSRACVAAASNCAARATFECFTVDVDLALKGACGVGDSVDFGADFADGPSGLTSTWLGAIFDEGHERPSLFDESFDSEIASNAFRGFAGILWLLFGLTVFAGETSPRSEPTAAAATTGLCSDETLESTGGCKICRSVSRSSCSTSSDSSGAFSSDSLIVHKHLHYSKRSSDTAPGKATVLLSSSHQSNNNNLRQKCGQHFP